MLPQSIVHWIQSPYQWQQTSDSSEKNLENNVHSKEHIQPSVKSRSYFLTPPTAFGILGTWNHRNAGKQYRKHLFSARKSILLHKALEKRKTYKFWGCERWLCLDSPCPFPVCLHTLEDCFSKADCMFKDTCLCGFQKFQAVNHRHSHLHLHNHNTWPSCS